MNGLKSSRLWLWMPSMDNGVIDKIDIDSDNVVVFINYDNSLKGDTIRLYMEGTEISNATIDGPSALPLTFKIPPEILIDGPGFIFYEVADEINNVSRSDDYYIYVDKESTGPVLLAPPVYGGDDRCVSQDEYNFYSGLFVSIPPSEVLQNHIGDTLTIKMTRYNPQGGIIENGSLESNFVIDKNISENGMTYTFPEENVQFDLSGSAIIAYYVHSRSELIFSEQTILKIGNCDSSGYTIIVTSDRDQIYADGNDFAIITALVRDLNNLPIVGATIIWSISAGHITAISETNSDGKALASLSSTEETRIQVIARLNDSDYGSTYVTANKDVIRELPAPTFPQSNGENYIPSQTLVDDNLLYVEIRYPNMYYDDIITLNTSGITAEDQVVSDAISVTSHSVSFDEQASHVVSIQLTPELALSVQSGGKFFANYSVTNTDNPGIKYSSTGFFILDRTKVTLITTGAPIYSSTYGILPKNHGVIYGTAGALFSLTCTGDAYFPDNESMQSLTVSLDEQGEGRFDISALHVGATTITGTNNNDVTQNFNIITHFDDYLFGQDYFHAAQRTTKAPADGKTPNSLYVICQPNAGITECTVSVNNGALLSGGGQTGTFLFNADNATAIDIVKTSPGLVDIQIILGTYGNEWKLSTEFI